MLNLSRFATISLINCCLLSGTSLASDQYKADELTDDQKVAKGVQLITEITQQDGFYNAIVASATSLEAVSSLASLEEEPTGELGASYLELQELQKQNEELKALLDQRRSLTAVLNKRLEALQQQAEEQQDKIGNLEDAVTQMRQQAKEQARQQYEAGKITLEEYEAKLEKIASIEKRYKN